MSAGDKDHLGWDRDVELEAVVTGTGIGGPLGWRVGFQSSWAGEGDPPGWNGGKITTVGIHGHSAGNGGYCNQDRGSWELETGTQVPGSMGTELEMRVTPAGIQGPSAGGKGPCPGSGAAGLEKAGRVAQG